MNSLVKWRFYAVIFVLLAAAVVVLSRYAFHIIASDSDQGGRPRTYAERGKIMDRNGKVLASQINLYNVYASSPPKDEIRDLADGLAPLLDMSSEGLYDRLSRGGRNILLKRQVPASIMEMIKNEQRNGRFRGISTIPVPSRTYPEKNLAAQIIGFTGIDNYGREGVEYAFNKELSTGNNVVLTLDITSSIFWKK